MLMAGIEKPRIAVAALNPHAGEGGLFGREEIEILAPAIKKMRSEGINCKGPFPCDTIYTKAFAGDYDSVLSMYHDQAQIATKLKGFNKGVTITAGLDIVFTTPAHGTAFDVVGKGIADIGAYEAAIRLAARIAARKKASSTAAASPTHLAVAGSA
jgi:4-hydroxy-L-threonine phosphate dehydrogenase PdxA